MRRLFVPRSQIAGDRLELSAEDRHYLCDVLRLAPGTELEVFDGEGGTYTAALSAERDGLSLGERRCTGGAPSPIWLAFALSKGEKNDLVVQKATELGATCLLPWSAERSVVRLEGDRAAQRTERWRRIAAEAARQCGRADIPEVVEPLPLGEVLRRVPAEFTRIVFYERGGEPIRDIARAPAAGWLAVIGPEGGLSASEISACLASGCRTATLGPRILRAETAAIATVALLATL